VHPVKYSTVHVFTPNSDSTMGEQVKNRKKLRFWGKGKKTKNTGKQVDMSTPMMMVNKSPAPVPVPAPATNANTNTNTNTGQAKAHRGRSRLTPGNINIHQQQSRTTLPSEYKSHPATPPDAKHTARAKDTTGPTHTPQAARQSSESFTPKTLPPSPTRSRTGTGTGTGTPIWQESDEDKKIKAMARLHNLAREHTKHVPKQSIPNALRSLPDEPDPLPSKQKTLFQGRDQQVIDAVLGINPCVPIETKAVIKKYASKPTPPNKVVNMAMLKEGSSKVFLLAKEGVRESVGKLMNCAADLKDLDEGNTLCFSDFKKDRFMKRRSHHRDFYDDDDESSDDDDAGTFAGLSVKDGRESPVSRLGNGISMDFSEATSFASEDEESLGQGVMNVLQKNPPIRTGAPPPTHEVEEMTHRMPIMRVSSSRRAAEINRRANSMGAQHLQPSASSGRGNGNGNGATSGLTSLRELTNTKHRDSSGEPLREASKFEQANANPTTSITMPFDERSDVYDDGDGDVYDPVELYGSSALGNGSPGRHLQLAEGNVFVAGSKQMKNISKREYQVQRRLSDRGI